MTNTKSIVLSIFVGGAICGLIYLGLKSSNVDYVQEDLNANAKANADADAIGGSRKRRGKKVKKSRRKGKKH